MNDSKNRPGILYTGHLLSLEQQISDGVRDFKGNNPLAEVWVVVPNQLTRLHLRRVLAKALGIVANVRFMTVTDLMHKLAEPLVMRDGWRTLGEAVVDPLLAEIVAANMHKLEYLGPVAATRGFRSALLRTRKELILHQVQLESLSQVPLRERERAAKVRDLITLLKLIEDFLNKHKLHDGASLQALALQAVHESSPQIQPILLYSLYDAAPLTRAVLRQVAEIAPARGYLPWVAGQAGYMYTESLLRWYLDCGFSHKILDGSDAPYASINFVSAPKDSFVASEIIRDVIYGESEKAGEDAVMLPNGSALLTSVLESRCRTSKLSPYIYQAKTLGQTAEGRGFTALANLLDGRYTREQVTSYLNAAPFTRTVASMAGDWSRLAQESQVIEGENEWVHRISRMVKKLERRAEKYTESDDEDSTLTTLKRRIESGKAMLEFVNNLFQVIEGVRNEQTWQTAVTKLWEYYVSETELSEDFADLTMQLEQGSLLDQTNVRLTPAGLTEFLLTTLETPGSRTGTFGTSTPLIAPREQCLGVTFDHTFLPGFNEGTLPQMQRQDPLLLDSDRKDINDTLKCVLPLAADSLVRERFFLEMQLRATRRTITAYTSRSDADGRPRLLSPYVAELMASQRGHEELESDPEKLFSEEPNRFVPAHPLKGCSPANAISESEYRRLALGQGADTIAFLLDDTEFAHRQRVEQYRFNERHFSRYEGAIQSPKVRAELDRQFSGEDPVAATGLEEYWKCPFRYLVFKQWEAYAPEELDSLRPVTSRERGLLFHSILQRYHGERINKPLTAEYFGLAELHVLADRVLREYARHNPVGPRFSYDKLEHEIMTTLSDYHRELMNMGSGWHTRHVEVGFGYGDNPFPAAAQYTSQDMRSIRFIGRIDRWDSDDIGAQVAITDYKSGKGPKNKSRGTERRLQLAVYHLLAQSQSPEASVTSRFIFLERDKDRIVVEDEEREQRLEASLDLLDDMRNGIFVPDSDMDDSAACKYCTAKLACGAQRHASKELNSETVVGMRTNRLSMDELLTNEGEDDE